MVTQFQFGGQLIGRHQFGVGGEMKKLIAIISGVSIAALIGLGNVALAGEKDDPKNQEDEAQSLNSTGNEVAVEGIKTPDDDDGNAAPRMKGDFSRDRTRDYEKAKDDDEDDSREKKKDKDG